jgi:sialate O-acetylesterase
MAFLFLLFSLHALADIRLPAIIGDHMVLQQNTDCKLWGWSNSNEKITITTSWDDSKTEVRADGTAKWMTSIK